MQGVTIAQFPRLLVAHRADSSSSHGEIMRSRTVVGFVATLIVSVAATSALAQTPQEQPRFQAGDLTYVGTFTVPDTDGTGTSEDNQFAYSAIGVAGVAGPGKLFYACHAQRSARLGIVEVPAIGGTAKVVEPCQQMPNLGAVGSDQSPRFTGGAMVYNGRTLVDAYIYYDGAGQQANTHWYGSSLSSMTGPVNVQANNVWLTNVNGVQYRPKAGMMAGWMGLVPQEWRALMGGPAFTGQGAIAITSRSSFGPALSVFNPDDLGKTNPVPATMLIGYPDEHKDLGEWGAGPWGTSPISPYYSGADTLGTVFWPLGTRSVVSIGRHGTGMPEMNGMNCYGPGTNNKALIGEPDGQGNRYCYDPSNSNKGPHSYPYKAQAMAYDALDMLAVKQGTKQPWDLRPYAVWNFGGGTPLDQPGVTIVGAAYDQSARRLYVSSGSTVVHVFEVKSGAPPPVETCGDGVDNDGDGLIDEDCVEVCGDKIDNDQDGAVDEGCEDPAALPGVPTRVSGSVKRSRIALNWTAPLTGGAVVDYVIEAGVAPGQTLYTTPVGNITSVAVPGVGTGRYYVRVRARNANGLSAPSNEVVLSVGCTKAPLAPTGLTANISEGLVSLAWTDPDGCSGTTNTVSIGTSENTADVRVLSSEDTSVTMLLAKGTYFARVTTHSDIGTSQSSALRFTVKGDQCVTPRFRTKLNSSVRGRRVGISWSPSDPDLAFDDDKVSPVSYVIEAGSISGSADYGSAPMGRERAFLTDAPPGVYFVRVRPVNACGAGAASNEARLHVR